MSFKQDILGARYYDKVKKISWYKDIMIKSEGILLADFLTNLARYHNKIKKYPGSKIS